MLDYLLDKIILIALYILPIAFVVVMWHTIKHGVDHYLKNKKRVNIVTFLIMVAFFALGTLAAIYNV